MHYYQFHIGDYHADTAHLDDMEDLAYRRMLDLYYKEEQPLPLDIERIAKLIRMRSHSDCIASVLREYFERTENGWINHRAEDDLAQIRKKSAKAKASAEARWAKKSKQKQSVNTSAMRTHNERNANGMLPITQYPLPNKEKNTKKETLNFEQWPEPPSASVLADYKKTRKKALTQTAINRMAKELHAAASKGLSVDECLSVCCEAGWQGFKLEWYLNREVKNGDSRQNSSGLTGAAKRAQDHHDTIKRYAQGGAAAALGGKDF